MKKTHNIDVVIHLNHTTHVMYYNNVLDFNFQASCR